MASSSPLCPNAERTRTAWRWCPTTATLNQWPMGQKNAQLPWLGLDGPRNVTSCTWALGGSRLEQWLQGLAWFAPYWTAPLRTVPLPPPTPCCLPAAPVSLTCFPWKSFFHKSLYMKPHLRVCFWGTSSKTLVYSWCAKKLASFPPWSSICLLQVTVGFGNSITQSGPSAPLPFPEGRPASRVYPADLFSVCCPSEPGWGWFWEPMCLLRSLGVKIQAFVCWSIYAGIDTSNLRLRERSRSRLNDSSVILESGEHWQGLNDSGSRDHNSGFLPWVCRNWKAGMRFSFFFPAWHRMAQTN